MIFDKRRRSPRAQDAGATVPKSDRNSHAAIDRSDVRSALDNLLVQRGYDEIGEQLIAKSAGMTVADFRSMYTNKAWAVSDAFYFRYQDLERSTLADLSLSSPNEHYEEALQGHLHTHLERFSELVSSTPENRRLAEALVRAFALESVGVGRTNESVLVPVARLPQTIVDRLLARDPVRFEHLLIRRLGEMWTLDLLIVALGHQDPTRAVRRFLDLSVSPVRTRR